MITQVIFDETYSLCFCPEHPKPRWILYYISGGALYPIAAVDRAGERLDNNPVAKEHERAVEEALTLLRNGPVV